MKIIMITQKGCVKCDAAKARLGDKLRKVRVMDIAEHPELTKKYNLEGSTPLFILDSEDGFFETFKSVIFIEKYL